MYNLNKTFSISNRFKSFLYSLNGLKEFFKTQHNAWIEGFATIVILFLGINFEVSSTEWALLIFAIGLVLIAETINTSIEYLTDIVSPSFNERAGKVKDIASAAVLIAVITASIIGALIFSKYI